MVKKTKRSLWVIEEKTKDQKNYVGIHLIAEFWNGKIIEKKKEIKKILIEAARLAKATPLRVSVQKFPPQGLTGVVLLAESHISIHTWPEINYVAIDIFTCGRKIRPYKALDYLKGVFQPKKVRIREVKRGKI